jgi:hypothetical protein
MVVSIPPPEKGNARLTAGRQGVRRQRLGQLFLGLRQGADILHAGALQGVRIPDTTGDEIGDSMVYDYSGVFEPGVSRNS